MTTRPAVSEPRPELAEAPGAHAQDAADRPTPPGLRGFVLQAPPLAATTIRRAATLVREHRALNLVLAAYALSALIVPTLTPVPVGDDWVYARSVEILLTEGRLEIFDLAIATLLFQVAWGALFALLFDPTFGVLRLSTVVLVALSAAPFYALCRQLGLDRGLSALGTAAYLFNPLAFVLAFSYMTDAPFMALLVIATWLYARGLDPTTPDRRAVLAGSAVAALAFLVRQQGAFIPFAVALQLLLTRRLRPNRAGATLLLTVAAAPATTTVLYYLWLHFIYGVPAWQSNFLQRMLDTPWAEGWVLIARMIFVIGMYAGLFALPVLAAGLPGVGQLVRSTSTVGWMLFCAWEALLVAGMVNFLWERRRMPYLEQYLGPWGLGPPDIVGLRPTIFTEAHWWWVTLACLAGALLLGLVLVRRAGTPQGPGAGAAGLALLVALWQAIGALPPSFSFREWGLISLDRYLLPLIPFAVCLGLWGLRGVRLAQPAAWLIVALFAFIAVAGTRDLLVFQEATWSVARAANAAGVPNTRLDGGASWDGYHLYEYSRRNRIPPQTPEPRPWWTGLFAPATDASYIVSSAPYTDVSGFPYAVVTRVEYSSWLHREPVYLYLLRRQGLPWPP